MSYPETKCFLVDRVGWDKEAGQTRFRIVDSGEEFLGYRPGMMFYETDIEDGWRKKLAGETREDGSLIEYPFERYWHFGPDNRILAVVCPNGQLWRIDSYCSNCTRREELHSCWCRHGTAPNITVNKTPNDGETTCAAGAGSIQADDYHGFLQNGVLTAG